MSDLAGGLILLAMVAVPITLLVRSVNRKRGAVAQSTTPNRSRPPSWESTSLRVQLARAGDRAEAFRVALAWIRAPEELRAEIRDTHPEEAAQFDELKRVMILDDGDFRARIKTLKASEEFTTEIEQQLLDLASRSEAEAALLKRMAISFYEEPWVAPFTELKKRYRAAGRKEEADSIQQRRDALPPLGKP